MRSYENLLEAAPAAAMATYAVPVENATYGIAFAAAPAFLSGAQLPPLYNDTTFRSTQPQAQQATILQAAPQMQSQACTPSARLPVARDPLAAHVADTFRKVTGRHPEPADITPDVVWAARQSACSSEGNEGLCAAASFAYGRALASQVRTTAAAPAVSCSLRAGVPVPAVMADNAAIVQGVTATLQALQGAPTAQARALNAVLSEQQSLASEVAEAKPV